MAVAGRVAIVPDGTYTPEKKYKRLSMVYSEEDGSSYVSKKSENLGNPLTDEEYWQISARGASGKASKIQYDNTLSELAAENVQVALDELADRTELATPEKPGIVQPDGKTIKIENNLLVGAASGLTLAKQEFEEKFANGEIEDGTIVNVTDDYLTPFDIDNRLSETSLNPVQNKIITVALKETNNRFGGITLSVTEAGLVRASWEDTEQEGQ